MSSLILEAVMIAAFAGLVIKLILDYQKNDLEITWAEYWLGLAGISLVLVPLITWAGWSLAASSNLSFNEYKNGWELEAVANHIQCSRDGPCWYEYDCDPYIVMVAYSCNCTTDKNGSTSCDTCYRPETRYHDCPYVIVETSYDVRTTLGDFSIAKHRFPENPDGHRWRSAESVPTSVVDRAGVGDPPFWTKVNKRVRAGRPGPVTQRGSYDNYILASDSTILNQYSGVVDHLLSAKMMPLLSKDVHDFYSATKVYFVGSLSADRDLWTEKVAYVNAALGSELQGDLHLVLINDSDLRKTGSNPDEYLLALRAYWQNPKYFQKDALSKNTIVVIVGTKDSATVSWARALTGMPLGNERMVVEIRNSLEGTEFTPEAVVGNIRGYFEVYAQRVMNAHEASGKLDSILWGLNLKETRFRRISMTAKDHDDIGTGFEYLANEIKLTDFQRGMILFVSLLGCLGVWLAAAVHGIRDPRKHSAPLDLNRIEEWWKSQWRETRLWAIALGHNLADKVGKRRK